MKGEHKYKMKRWHKYKMRRGHKYKMDKYGLLYAVMQFVAAWGLRFAQKIVGGGLLWVVLTYKVGSWESNIASARGGGLQRSSYLLTTTRWEWANLDTLIYIIMYNGT